MSADILRKIQYARAALAAQSKGKVISETAH